MNIAPVHAPVVHATEPPRPAQPPAVESARPVLAPPSVDAQHVRDDRARRSDHETKAAAQPQQPPESGGKGGQDPLVGAILDVFA